MVSTGKLILQQVNFTFDQAAQPESSAVLSCYGCKNSSTAIQNRSSHGVHWKIVLNHNTGRKNTTNQAIPFDYGKSITPKDIYNTKI